MEEGDVHPLRYAGSDESHALSPLGERKKSVLPMSRVTIKAMIAGRNSMFESREFVVAR